MSQEIKIEKKASEVIQPASAEEARQAIKSKKDLSRANLRDMALEKLNAVGAVLRKTDLTGANLSHGLLLNPNLYRATVHGAIVRHTVIFGGDLVKTSFNNANLEDSAIIGTDAQEASFKGANLRNADLVSSNFEDADFTDADLTNARLAGLNVTGANFAGAVTTGAKAYHIDWSKAKAAPVILPDPFVNLPVWAWSVLAGGLLGVISLVIYAMIKKKKSS